MIKTQIDQYDMLLSVENHFDDNAAIWSANVPLAAAKTVLSSKIDLLAVQVALQLQNPTGVTKDKAKLRDELENKGFTLSAAASAYAAAVGRNDLYEQVHINKSAFQLFRDAELVGVITNLHRDATVEIANLAPYGVTAASLTDLLTANNAFGLIMKNPTSAIAKRKTATDAIAVIIPEIIEILETRIDNLMVGLTASQPQFVEVYNAVRALNSSPTYKLSATITTLDAVSNTPIANANLAVENQGITRTSSQRGYNTIQNLPEGAHQLVVSHPNYVTQTVPFTIVANETTEIVVELQPK